MKGGRGARIQFYGRRIQFSAMFLTPPHEGTAETEQIILTLERRHIYFTCITCKFAVFSWHKTWVFFEAQNTHRSQVSSQQELNSSWCVNTPVAASLMKQQIAIYFLNMKRILPFHLPLWKQEDFVHTS